MKLKRWLIISYIIVMLAPIVTGIGLFTWIQNYNQKRELKDYINVISDFEKYDKKLQNPEIYLHISENYNLIEEDDKNRAEINLYNKDGMKIYSSFQSDMVYNLDKEQLYKDLYELKHGYRADSIKKPVFYKAELVGFYELTIVRGKWIEGVNNRSMIAYCMFTSVLLFVFFIVIKLLDKKLNKPVELLMRNMTDYAIGKEDLSIEYNKKDEIGELIKHFNSMKTEIDSQKEEVKSQQKSKEYMIASISHDLKTPLTSIRAYAESLSCYKGLSEVEVQEYIAVIINKSDYMKSMLDDLLTYTILTRDYKFDFVEVDGNEFFEMLFSGYYELCEKSGIKLTVSTSVCGNYKVDVKQMMRVVDNLVNNAVRYTENTQNIWLGAYSENENLPGWIDEDFRSQLDEWRSDGVVLLVKNEGKEIPIEIQEEIFKPFYQGDDSRNKAHKNGAGLGLSIVNIVIEKHQGKIKILSRKEAGTIIACWIKKNSNSR